MEEEWRPVKGYEEFYQVSNLGRVKSLACCRTVRSILRHNGYKRDETWHHKEKILKPIHESKRLVVRLYGRDHVRHSRSIKELVAKAFLDYPEGVSCCYIKQIVDGDDFSVSNLFVDWAKINSKISL